MNRSSSAKKNHLNRFSYLIDLSHQHKSHKKAQLQPQFNLNLCAQNPCKNQISQFEIVDHNFTEQQIKKRKPPKIQLQSINFQSFKRKIQQKSFPNSFLAYTPSKDSENQLFTIDNQISTIEYPNQKQIQSQRIDIPKISQEQMYHSQINFNKENSYTYLTPKSNEQNLFNSNFNDFIRLQLSQTEKSYFQSPREPSKMMSRTINEQFSTWGKNGLTLSTGKKSARLSDFQSSYLNIKQQFQSSITGNASQVKSGAKVSKKDSQHTIATVKTKQMSSRLSQNNSLQYEDCISWTPNNSSKVKVFDETVSTKSAIKLKGKTSTLKKL